MTMDRWQSIHSVVVVGLGITGLSVVKFLENLPHNLTIKVIDTRDNPPGQDELPPEVELHRGSWNQAWLLDADLVVASPGIALATPEVQRTLDAGIPVVGDIELFAWHVDKPVIAITGSNGKSTVTDLAGVVAKAVGLDVGVGGNIGVPALDLLTQPADLFILELSSFQLETTSSLKLKSAAFLNLSEDHMDRYQGMEEYRAAKLRIFEHAEFCIVNAEDQATYPEQAKGTIVEFSLTDETQYSAQVHQEREYLCKNNQPILATDELKIVGRHNVANALVVVALLESAGINVKKGVEALKSYNGLTHRCQIVADNHGVKWINDSKATNVASTLAALSGLTLSGKLYLLVGGVGKGADFSELTPILANLKLQLCCFGEDSSQFMPLHSSAKQFCCMEDIVKWVRPKLKAGDMVLLSPACASFDQFNNFMARGDAFTQLAQRYA